MAIYQTKARKLAATSYGEAIKKARRIFHEIEKQSKRKAYIRSAYFRKEKIFFDFFWDHLNQKSILNRTMRLIYLPCAIDLINNSRYQPISKVNPNKHREVLHRFSGMTPEKEVFHVQIKEDRKMKRKYLMSVFPSE